VLIWEVTDLPQVSEAVGPIRLFGYFAPISEKPFRGFVDGITNRIKAFKKPIASHWLFVDKLSVSPV
jgi:hypothetical protein